MDDPKIFGKTFFCLKSFLMAQFEKLSCKKWNLRIFKFFSHCDLPGLTLRKFSKHFLLKSSLNGTLKVIAIKVKFMDRIWNFITLKWKLKTLRSLLVVVSRSWDYCRSPTSYSSQLLVELYVENVGWLVGWLPPYLENGCNDFDETWHGLTEWKSKESDRARFFEKNFFF